jgi:hypothetical protein
MRRYGTLGGIALLVMTALSLPPLCAAQAAPAAAPTAPERPNVLI